MSDDEKEAIQELSDAEDCLMAASNALARAKRSTDAVDDLYFRTYKVWLIIEARTKRVPS